MSRGDTAVRIGTAGWSIPRAVAESFPGSGSHLERYSRVLNCAEINSSFYRPHRGSTYEKWAAATPEQFLFSVKVPKTITHECKLAPPREVVRAFLDECSPLAPRLGPILFQLPPRQSFDPEQARTFFAPFRDLYPKGHAVVEPRNAAWFTPEADELLAEFQIARVIADPARVPVANTPAPSARLIYYRLHGSPRMYYSSYPPEWLAQLAADIASSSRNAEVWCIFDNTASGAAAANALTLKDDLVLPAQAV